MKKRITIITSLLLNLSAFSAEIRILPTGTNKMEISSFYTFNFHLDEQYAEKLAEQKSEKYDPSTISYAKAPILLIIQKDAKGNNVFSVYSYHQDDKNSYFRKKKFKITDDVIHDIEPDDKEGYFMARKMPRLVMCEQKP